MDKNIASVIGMRLKIARKASGYKTSKEFAKKHHTASSTYSQHETGKRLLSVENLIAYSESLNINPGWTLTGEGPPCINQDLEKENRILQEIKSLEKKGLIPTSRGPIITGTRYTNIDIMAFKNILSVMIPLLKETTGTATNEQLIDFSFEIYNQIVIMDAEPEVKRALIGMSINSFFKGMKAKKIGGMVNKIANL
ncbi:MAG: hypothetical protein A3F41_06785 [Coxiella sp. RIFCSPHIGHO2_12_FULL_44_14]|nr:MAG: hypothetical protein A3F41_06785 [Coxiella sp. RIFCSPHIGHO2_12_FULL_44_14]